MQTPILLLVQHVLLARILQVMDLVHVRTALRWEVVTIPVLMVLPVACSVHLVHSTIKQAIHVNNVQLDTLTHTMLLLQISIPVKHVNQDIIVQLEVLLVPCVVLVPIQITLVPTIVLYVMLVLLIHTWVNQAACHVQLVKSALLRDYPPLQIV